MNRGTTKTASEPKLHAETHRKAHAVILLDHVQDLGKRPEDAELVAAALIVPADQDFLGNVVDRPPLHDVITVKKFDGLTE